MYRNIPSIKRPNRSFNLLHLEGTEIHVSKIRCTLFLENLTEEVDGYLHLCSRSISFEPVELSKPLLKLKFSNYIDMQVFQELHFSTLCGYVDAAKENPSALDKHQELKIFKEMSSMIRTFTIEKLFNTQPESNNTTPPERQLNVLVMKTDKIYSINRDPLTPYTTDKVSNALIFEISRENNQALTQEFFKMYFRILETTKGGEDLREEEMAEEIVKAALANYQAANEKILLFSCPAKNITPEGVVYGYTSLTNNGYLNFYPIVNNINKSNIQIKFSNIKAFIRYRYMFRHTALEVWEYNTHYSTLIDLLDENSRETVYAYLKNYADKILQKCFNREYFASQWVSGQLSNFEYLMFLNTISNRSFNDLSQYPVFPWVISDYTTEVFSLDDPNFFRDLSRTVGAINKNRLQKFKDGYEDLLNSKHGEQPYIYPTHYSTPGFVVYYLIRKIPEFVIKLQNGVFGPAERLFRSVESTWFQTVNVGPDVKELTPEFYSGDVDFLVNSERLQLGVTQDGELIDDVVLPAWAMNINDFVEKMKAALESEYVSMNLHNWIDLVFGYKQRGKNSMLYDNLFYPLTYEENVDWTRKMTQLEKEALEVQVTEFGQIPLLLFDTPHPPKKIKSSGMKKSSKDLLTGENDYMLNQVTAANEEVVRLRNELERVRIESLDSLEGQKEEFQMLERKKNEYIDKLIESHSNEKAKLQEEVAKLKRQNKEGASKGKDNTQYEKAITLIRQEYEEKLHSLANRHNFQEHLKNLEMTNQSLRGKLKQYEMAGATFKESPGKTLNSGKSTLRRTTEDYASN